MSNIEQLPAPFSPSRISWRVGATNQKKVARTTGQNNAKATKGIALAYIDARDVMERLDSTVGPENWQAEYSHTHPYICRIGIRINGEWVWKSNGAGDTAVEADKGGMSDAFKRAAVLWGIGRYLYGLENIWVDLDEYGKIKDSETWKLEKALSAAAPSQQKAAPNDTAQEESPFKKELTPAQQKYKEIRAALNAAKTVEDMQSIWVENETHRHSLPQEGQDTLYALYRDLRDELIKQKEAA